MVLCDRCAGIDFGSLIERACIEAAEGPANSASLQPYTIVQDLSFAALRRDATQGCDLCSLIHDGLLDRVSTRPTSEQLADDALIVVSITLERCHLDFSPTAVQCSALWVICSNRDVELDEKWIGLPLESEGYSQYVSGKRYFWNPSLWCSWMNDCANTHDTCNAIKRNGYAPTRVIDVGSIDTAPKLVGSNETHADAVKVTRSMGYQYLWVDCLCIIRDSEEDWLRECALMGEVYAGAALTVAAERSKSPLDGFLKTSSRPIKTCNIPIQWPSTGKSDELTVGLPTTPNVYYSLSSLLLMDYTARQLTKVSDWLPAISGVARIIAARFGWEYVAGMWSHDLEAALLWWVLEPRFPLSINPAHYSGPSWSWASADRQIYCHVPPISGKRYTRSWIQDGKSLLSLSGRDWVSRYEVVPGSKDTFKRIGMMMFERSENNGERWDEAIEWLLAAETKEIYLE
ncbi:hypothetical protein Q7P35_010103 [Cladosporium inversicolor]